MSIRGRAGHTDNATCGIYISLGEYKENSLLSFAHVWSKEEVCLEVEIVAEDHGQEMKGFHRLTNHHELGRCGATGRTAYTYIFIWGISSGGLMRFCMKVLVWFSALFLVLLPLDTSPL